MKETAEKEQKVRDLLINNSHPGAERFLTVSEVTEFGLEVDEYVGLLKQMHRNGELQFSVEDDKLDGVSSEAFFGQGIDGVELVVGLKNTAPAIRKVDQLPDGQTSSTDQAEQSKSAESKAKQNNVLNYVGKFQKGSKKDVPADSLIQYLTLKERALQCYKKLTANNLPDSYYVAPPCSWLVHFRLNEDEYTDEVTRYLAKPKPLEKRQSLSETDLSVIRDGAKSRGEQQDNELDAEESEVFPARIRHSTGASIQHRKTDKRKAQSEDVILEEEELEESPQRKAAAEERAQLHLERTV